MTAQQGNYNLQDALNRALPVFKRFGMGDWVVAVTNAINAMNAQGDMASAFVAGNIALGSGTVTIGGSIANGNSFTVAFVCSTIPALVTPGVIIGPIAIVTADTTTTVATKLTAAIQASATLLNSGITATSSGAVVTVKAPGVAGNSLVMTPALSSGAVITVTATSVTSGTGAVVGRNAGLYNIPTVASRA